MPDVPPQAITADERQAVAIVNAMADVKRHVLHRTAMWQAAGGEDVLVSTMARAQLIKDILEAAAPHLAAEAVAAERERCAQLADGLKFRLYRPAKDGPGGGVQALDVVPLHELLAALRQGGEGGTGG